MIKLFTDVLIRGGRYLHMEQTETFATWLHHHEIYIFVYWLVIPICTAYIITLNKIEIFFLSEHDQTYSHIFTRYEPDRLQLLQDTLIDEIVQCGGMRVEKYSRTRWKIIDFEIEIEIVQIW